MNARRCNYASEQTSCPHTETQKNIWKKGKYVCTCVIISKATYRVHHTNKPLAYLTARLAKLGTGAGALLFFVDDARKVIRSRCTYSSLFCNPVLKNYSAKVPCKI